MKPTFTNLEITRLAYSDSPNEITGKYESVNGEYHVLKKMQNIVDQCFSEPSQQSIDKILAALKSI